MVAGVGIVLTMAYLFRMMRGVFYGTAVTHHAHAHDTVSVVDRLPLLLMIACSIGFGIFPGHFYRVIRSGVDPLIARITAVSPLSADRRDAGDVTRHPSTNASPLTHHASRGHE
jgi:NADH-quinone oxidoreductase subunit M